MPGKLPSTRPQREVPGGLQAVGQGMRPKRKDPKVHLVQGDSGFFLNRMCRRFVSVEGPPANRRALVKRAILVGIAATGMVVASLAGCSNKSNTSYRTRAHRRVAQTRSPSMARNRTSQVRSAALQAGGNLNIAIGDPTNGIGAVISTATPPAVQSRRTGERQRRDARLRCRRAASRQRPGHKGR